MAKVIAKCVKKEKINNDLYVTFKIDDNTAKIDVDKNCEEGSLENISVSRYVPPRTRNQNSYFWKLVGLISKKQDLKPQEVERLLLLDANIKYTLCIIPLEAEDELKKQFKVVSLIARDFTDHNKGVYQCFYGSSEMNLEEFGRLLETAIKWCETLEIPVSES